MDAQKELLDAVQILIDKSSGLSTKILYVFVSAVNATNKECTVLLSGNSYVVPFYGSVPILGRKYPLFVPEGNMSISFIIG